MADDKTELPEGTDKIIAGASDDRRRPAATGGRRSSPNAIARPSSDADRPRPRLADKLREQPREAVRARPADKARGLVSQGLERSAEALANVAQAGRRHRRRASMSGSARNMATMPAAPPSAIEDAANSLAEQGSPTS